MSQCIRSKALNNIPKEKVDRAIELVRSSGEDELKKNTRTTAIMRFVEANIPIAYWNLKMDKDFFGDPNLKKEFDDYTADLKKTFVDGTSLCLAGNHGVGKSLTASCILKIVSLKGFSALYTTLSDVVAVLTQAPTEDKFEARRELQLVDFLVLDEVDPRFVGSDNASDLFGRNLENIFRTRSQNKLPTIICTNSPNVVESFSGTLKQSLGSLFAGGMKTVVVMGKDFRKNGVQKMKDIVKEIIKNTIEEIDQYSPIGFDIHGYKRRLKNSDFEAILERAKQDIPNLEASEIETTKHIGSLLRKMLEDCARNK